MSVVGQIERKTQDNVVALFRQQLGYDYLGNWEYREDNSHVEVELLTQNLLARGYAAALADKAIAELKKAASLGGGRTLYEANREVYDLLRYGVKVKRGVGELFETVWLVDWSNPGANHFAIAEEVSIKGEHTKRPDVVLYVNGVALGVIELKRSKVGVSEGIRQNIGIRGKTSSVRSSRPSSCYSRATTLMACATRPLIRLKGTGPSGKSPPRFRNRSTVGCSRCVRKIGSLNSSTTSLSLIPAPRRPPVITSTSG